MTKYLKYSGLVTGILCCFFSLTASGQSNRQLNKEKPASQGAKDTVILPAGDTTNKLIEIPFGVRTREELNYAVSSLRYNQLTKVPISNLSG